MSTERHKIPGTELRTSWDIFMNLYQTPDVPAKRKCSHFFQISAKVVKPWFGQNFMR